MDTAPGLHHDQQVPWCILACSSQWSGPPGHAPVRRPLHVGESQHHHLQHHRWETVGGPGEGEEGRGVRRQAASIVYLSSCVYLLLPLLAPYQSGESEIVNHTTGDKCILKWNPYSYFSRERQRKVLGHTHSILICVEVSAPDRVYPLF